MRWASAFIQDNTDPHGPSFPGTAVETTLGDFQYDLNTSPIFANYEEVRAPYTPRAGQPAFPDQTFGALHGRDVNHSTSVWYTYRLVSALINGVDDVEGTFFTT